MRNLIFLVMCVFLVKSKNAGNHEFNDGVQGGPGTFTGFAQGDCFSGLSRGTWQMAEKRACAEVVTGNDIYNGFKIK